MDKAKFENNIISAYEISLNYELETTIRKASRVKKLLCPDSTCRSPILRYCHGDKKEAYFAHLSDANCDYIRFDKTDTKRLKELRIKLYEHFKTLGYNVEMECKLLAHHYSPLYCFNDSEKVVIEMGSSKTTLKFIENIEKEYSEKNLNVKWLIIGEEKKNTKENNVSCLKRYLFNESRNKDFVLINNKDEIMQYRYSKEVNSLNDNLGYKIYKTVYENRGTLQDIIIENGELSLQGYNHKYNLWIQKIKKNYEEFQSTSQKEESEKKQQEQKVVEEKTININNSKSLSNKKAYDLFEKRRAFHEKVYTCEICGKKGTSEDFYSMCGEFGKCKECKRKEK